MPPSLAVRRYLSRMGMLCEDILEKSSLLRIRSAKIDKIRSLSFAQEKVEAARFHEVLFVGIGLVAAQKDTATMRREANAMLTIPTRGQKHRWQGVHCPPTPSVSVSRRDLLAQHAHIGPL